MNSSEKLTFHPLIRLDKLEELINGGHFWLTSPQDGHRLTEVETALIIVDLQVKGYTYLPVCSNINKDGACLGHKGAL